VRSERIVIHGRVQGVGFRYATLCAARKFGIRGTVRNRSDGTVEVEAVVSIQPDWSPDP